MEKRIFGAYTRKSKFTGKGETEVMQMDEIKKYINNSFSNYEIIIQEYNEPEGKSGANTDREVYQNLMAAVCSCEIDYIVCYKLDRFSRSISQFADALDEIEEIGAPNKDGCVGFISVSDGISTDTNMGKSMLYFSIIFAELEKNLIRERSMDTVITMAKQGKVMGGKCPLGYVTKKVPKKELDSLGREKYYTIYEDADELEQEMVRTIFEKYLELKSVTKVETYLLQKYMTTKSDKDYGRYALQHILTNPAYCINDKDAYHYIKEHHYGLYSSQEEFNGENALIGYRKTSLSVEKREREQRKKRDKLKRKSSNKVVKKCHRYNDVGDWIVAVAEHRGLIDGKTWGRVQDLMDGNKEKSYNKERKTEPLLSGLLICKECGSKMRPKINRKVYGDGGRAFSYLCSMKEKSKSERCKMENAPGRELDNLVLGELFKIAEGVQFIYPNSYRGENFVDDNTSGSIERELILKQITQKEDEIKNYNMAIKKANSKDNSEELIDSFIDNILETKKKIEELKRMIESLVRIEGKGLKSANKEDLTNILSEFNENCWALIPFEMKKAHLKKAIEKIEWDGLNAVITYRYSSKMVVLKEENDKQETEVISKHQNEDMELH